MRRSGEVVHYCDLFFECLRPGNQYPEYPGSIDLIRHFNGLPADDRACLLRKTLESQRYDVLLAMYHTGFFHDVFVTDNFFVGEKRELVLDYESARYRDPWHKKFFTTLMDYLESHAAQSIEGKVMAALLWVLSYKSIPLDVFYAYEEVGINISRHVLSFFCYDHRQLDPQALVDGKWRLKDINLYSNLSNFSLISAVNQALESCFFMTLDKGWFNVADKLRRFVRPNYGPNAQLSSWHLLVPDEKLKLRPYLMRHPALPLDECQNLLMHCARQSATTNRNKLPYLHHFTAEGRADVVEFLLKKAGFKPSFQYSGMTAAEYAEQLLSGPLSAERHAGVVRCLTALSGSETIRSSVQLFVPRTSQQVCFDILLRHVEAGREKLALRTLHHLVKHLQVPKERIRCLCAEVVRTSPHAQNEASVLAIETQLTALIDEYVGAVACQPSL